MNKFLVFVIIFLQPTLLDRMSNVSRLILWNVGHGQWVTVASGEECYHFDMGGEQISWNQVATLCKNKKNIAFFTHWDWDHIDLALKARRYLPSLCISRLPAGPASMGKRLFMQQLPTCAQTKNEKRLITELKLDPPKPKAKANDWSRVFVVQHKVLITGDSPIGQERRWLQTLAAAYSINILILGHHGSRTSTSSELLSHLPNLKLALVSCNPKRYGHPHSVVVRKLRERLTPLIETHRWNNIVLEL